MRTGLQELFKKLYFKQWVIGLTYGDIKEIITTRTFDKEIYWLPIDNFSNFYGDPFILGKDDDNNINILFEDFSFDKDYGNISLMTLDKDFRRVSQKVLLDTGSHLSYPFYFKENDKIYVFPEAAKSGKLSCYEYIPENKSLNYLADIVNLPLLDSTIIKYNDKYWIFGTVSSHKSGLSLHVFFSDDLLGPYTIHPANPVKTGFNGTRSAGSFIEVNNVIYRPSQNCERAYGESITINKILTLNEFKVVEEPYMTICVNKKDQQIHGIQRVHTINVLNDLIVVDGRKWTFSLKEQWVNFLRNRRLLKQSGRAN